VSTSSKDATAPHDGTVDEVTHPEHEVSTGNGKRSDEPSEFGAGFVAGIAAAVQGEPVAGADTNLAGAVALGWYVAALAHEGPMLESAAAARGDLMTTAALADRQVADFCLTQVQAAFAKLNGLVDKSTLRLPALATLEACIGEDAKRQHAAAAVDGKTLAILSAVDSRVGRAYGVGRALLNLTTQPVGNATLANQLSPERVAPVMAALDDISSALSPHAGHSVRASLKEWYESVSDHSPVVSDEPSARLQLSRQGELWRSLLSGEKSGLDMLEIQDYTDAADRLSQHTRTVAGRLIVQFRWAAVAIVVLFAGGIALAALDTKSAAPGIAGAGTILASLGLTWKGAGRALGQLTGRLERPLWGAELDTAITQAITLLAHEDNKKKDPEKQNDRDIAQQRREVAVALGAVRREKAQESSGSA
jgi:hypothetical protein